MGTTSLSILTPSLSSSSKPFQHQEEDPPNPTTSLLSPPPSPPQSAISKTTLIFSALLLTTSIAIAASIAFALLYFSSSTPPHPQISLPLTARPLAHIPKPTVILVSSDGFRFGYQFKTDTPNIARLIANGTEAYPGLIPVFPTLTFPNHYSIATGLYPASHGIINNRFLDPVAGDVFTMQSHDPKWWLGEPLWVTAVNEGLKAATFFWPGSEVHKGKWDCPVNFCRNYNGSVPFEERVDTVLSYFDLPKEEIPSFITLYFEDPDSQGHQVGPDDPAITEAVSRIDGMIGRLIQGLEKRGAFDDADIILVGDHGMVGTCDRKVIALQDLAPWIEIPTSWIHSLTPVLALKPPADVDAKNVVAKMTEGLGSGKVENGIRLKMFLKEDLPSRLHYSGSDRIPPIIGLLEEGYKVELNRSNSKECGGAHGYDNEFFSMRSIFVGHGPHFERGRKVPSFENVEIYNLVTAILKIEGAENNGTASFPKSILLPTAR
ncbi:hypothetical protein ACLOJK_037822 [Asimina triloba]